MSLAQSLIGQKHISKEQCDKWLETEFKREKNAKAEKEEKRVFLTITKTDVRTFSSDSD